MFLRNVQAFLVYFVLYMVLTFPAQCILSVLFLMFRYFEVIQVNLMFAIFSGTIFHFCFFVCNVSWAVFISLMALILESPTEKFIREHTERVEELFKR